MGSDCEQSINDHDHLEMVVGTKARFGGCMGQTEAWDMTKGVPLALTLMNYEQTNFVSEWSRGDRAGVSKPKSQFKKSATRHYENVLQHICQLCE